MKAINLPHFKLKLRDVSRGLYIEHGWHMPSGLARSAERDPRNVTREEWQQAKRAEKDPRQLKELFQDCWAISDSGKAFAQALEARGMYLARGDRRGFVAIDTAGEVYSIPKWTGLKTKVIAARLGDPAALRSVGQTNAYIADLLKGMRGRHLAEARQAHAAQRQPLMDRKTELRRLQREQRAQLRLKQEQRTVAEARQRVARIRAGLRGVWDRMTGRYARTAQMNEDEARTALLRDEQERQALIQSQLRDRQALQVEITRLGDLQTAEILMLHREMAGADGDAELHVHQEASIGRGYTAASEYRFEPP